MSKAVAREEGAWDGLIEKMGKAMEMLGVITRLSRATKQWMILTIDVLLVPVAMLLAMALQLNALPDSTHMMRNWMLIPILMALCALIEIGMNILVGGRH